MPMVRSSSTTRMRGVIAASPRAGGITSAACRRGSRQPAPVRGDASIRPPCASTVRLAIASPSPVPWLEREERLEEPRQRLGRHARPVVARPASLAVPSSPRDGDGDALAAAALASASTAFSIRLISTWRSFSRSARATTPCGDVELDARRSPASRRGRNGSSVAARERRRGRPRSKLELLAAREAQQRRQPGARRARARRGSASACSADAATAGSRASCCARLRAAVTGLRISCAMRAASLADRGELLGVRERALDRHARARAAPRRRARARAGRRTPAPLRSPRR